MSIFERKFVEIANYVVAVISDEKGNVAPSFNISTKEVAQNISKLRDAQDNDNPFMVINIDTVCKKMEEWKNLLPQVKPYYAVKCNNDPVLLRVLAKLGVGFDCASKSEIEMIVGERIASGNDIIYANPCKTRSYIEHAEKRGIRKTTFDSAEELSKIKKHHTSPELILRIDVADETAQCPLAAKFGCDPFRDGFKLIAKAKDLGLEVIGVSFHVGSGCRNPTAFRRAIFASRKLFSFGNKIGLNMRLLDIGGGFPGHDTDQISFSQICQIIQKAMDDYFSDYSTELEIVAEPGRFFAASAVSLCANVISKSRVPISRITKNPTDDGEGFMYFINDGVYGSFNCILFDHYQPTGEPLFNNIGNSQNFKTTVWGPTCDSLDRVEDITEMTELDVGEWIYYPNMGAYTSVAASNFNGFQPPQKYYIIGEKYCKAIIGNSMNDEEKLTESNYCHLESKIIEGQNDRNDIGECF